MAKKSSSKAKKNPDVPATSNDHYHTIHPPNSSPRAVLVKKGGKKKGK